MALNKAKLMESISQLVEITPEILAAVTQEITEAAIEYKASYGEYQSGG